MPVSMSAGVATPELSEEKLAAARKWLEENRHHLDLYNDPALLGPSANSNANDDDDVAATAKRAKNGESYDDVSDDDDEEEEDDEEKATERMRKAFHERTLRGCVRLMDAWFNKTPTEREKDEIEKVKNVLRKQRCDPPIAPDEPAPMTIRPYDCDPGDHQHDYQFTFKNALTTVFDVKRVMAKRDNVPREALDVVLGGKKLADRETLLECGVGAGYIVYLRVDPAKFREMATTTMEQFPGGERVPITRMVHKDGTFTLE